MSFIPASIDVISMGCSKNLVDSERLMRRLEEKGYSLNHNPEIPQGEYVVVNTCGFIADAKTESIDLLLELGRLKEEGRIGRIVVMGCLSERYRNELPAEMPEIDFWYGKFDWKSFIEELPDLSVSLSSPLKEWERVLTTPQGSAYLKISEGCDRFCAFCAIPIITGRHTSRPQEEILAEVRELVANGVTEFNVIAQDLSSYGKDLYGRVTLPELIDRMADIPGVRWIRLHYAYPADFPMELLDVMARRENVCKYLDIALQHISDPVLTNMRRHITGAETRRLLAEMRRRVPDIKIRTTLMVGFPGEGEKEFEELKEFVRETRFDRMGAFAYCEEDDTWGARHLDDSIPEEVKQARLDEIMELQQTISEELNQEMVGRRVTVLIDRLEDNGNPDGLPTGVGRTQWDSPDVDLEVYVTDCPAQPGEYIEAEITSASEFDLFARPVAE